MRRKFLSLGAAGAAGAAMAGLAPREAAAQTVDEIIRRGRLVVAIDTTTPPYASLDQRGQPQGIDVDVARALGRFMNIPVDFVTVNSPGRIPALLANRVDLVVAIFSVTPERALQVAFSIPYAGQSAVLIAAKDRQVTGPDNLRGLRVGVTRGALEDGALTALNIPNINILRFDDGPSVAQAMLSGQLDAMGGGDYGEVYLRRGARGEEYEAKFVLRAAHFGIGLRRGNPDLLQWLNTAVYSLKNSGELDTISRRWRDGAPMMQLPVF
jgi:polar amino acid transport system substrate-binding protein